MKTEKPGFNGNSTVRFVYVYGDSGRLIKVTTSNVFGIIQGGGILGAGGATTPGVGGPPGTGIAPTLYEYDSLGRLFRTGQDEDGNGSLDPESSDPITETEDCYEQDTSGNWWLKSTTKVYAAADSTSTLTVNTTKRQLTGLPSGVTDVTVSIDRNGLETISTTAVDRENKIVTETIDVPGSDVDAVTIIRNGLVQSSTTPEGITYTYAYDGVGRRTQVADPRTGTQTTTYNANTGQVDSVTDHEGRTTTYTYYTNNDYKKGMLQTVTNPVLEGQSADERTFITYNYNGLEQVVSISGDATHNVEIGYDSYGQRTSLTTHGQAGSSSTTWRYHDATGLLTTKKYPDSSEVTYTYTTGGLMKTRTWARAGGGAVPILKTSYSYFTRLGQLQKIDYSDATPDVEFTYDRLGQLATVIDGVGTRTFTDNYVLAPIASRVEVIAGLYDKTVAFVDWNRLSSVGDEYTEWRITAGPPADIDGDYVSDYMSDDRGRISRVMGPGLTTAGVKYHYITDSQDPTLALSSLIDRVEYMRPDGQGGEEVAGSIVRSYEDHRNLYTSVANNWDATNVSTYAYENDNMGRRTHNLRSGSAFSQTHFDLYGYNDKSELADSTRYIGSDPANPPTPSVGALTYGYMYDGIGNRSTFEVDSVQTTYTPNNLNQYESTTTPAESFTHDLDGNMTQDSTFDYAWDAENRLKSVTPRSPATGDQKLVYAYDYRGRRVQKLAYDWDGAIGETGDWSTTPSLDRRFLWHGWMLLMELDENNDVVRKYTWGLDLSGRLHEAGGIGGLLACDDANGTPSVTADDRSYAYFYDANGNVGQLVDTTDPADANYGTIAAAYEYDPYGNIQASSGPFADANPFRFSTKYFDAELDYVGTTNDGLYYYGYRYYSPRLGRWMSRDPIGERGGQNLLAFAGNQPNRIVDALGLKCYCGPDVTAYVKSLVNSAINWRREQHILWGTQGIRGTKWIHDYGSKLDWESDKAQFETKQGKCPSSGCELTYTLCGECVHDHWIGNFMYGFLSRLLSIPDFAADAGAQWIQGTGRGDKHVDDQGVSIVYLDPPWDRAGYELARNLYDKLRESPVELCSTLKSDKKLWDEANDTSTTLDVLVPTSMVRPFPPRRLRYPSPRTTNQKNCEPCSEDVDQFKNEPKVPGSAVGSDWPDV